MKNKKKAPEFEQLGDLQAEIMRAVWALDEATVQDVQAALAPHRPLAYTTVMTVMTRLVDQGLLERHKVSRAYLYRPVKSQEQVAGSLLRSLVQRFYNGGTASAIAHLLETDEEVDETELQRLEELIRARRKGQQA